MRVIKDGEVGHTAPNDRNKRVRVIAVVYEEEELS